MTTLIKRKANKDHFCDGPCKIKRIHKGKKYFYWQDNGVGAQYATRFYPKAKKYHPWCLPTVPPWLERVAVFPQRRRNSRRGSNVR